MRWVLFALIITTLSNCNQDRIPVMKLVKPNYKSFSLTSTTDTIRFQLHSEVYNGTRSFNYFIDEGIEYISFYDKQSLSINIYDFKSQSLVKRLSLKNSLPHRKLSKHTTVYCKSLDSIFVINYLMLFRLNERGIPQDSVDFERSDILAFPSFGSTTPPSFFDNKVIIAATPYLSTSKRKEIRKWRIFYYVDLKKRSANLLWPLPNRYYDSIYGYYFFDFSYCVNNNKRLVLSFPADSLIYETNLEDYYVAYSCKTLFQKGDISSLSRSEIEEEDGKRKAFLLRDSYKSIYYIPQNNLYLRIAEHKMSEREYMLGRREKDQSIIIMDRGFQVIGELPIKNDILISTLFITAEGQMFTRTKIRDENYLYFVRVSLTETKASDQLVSN